VPVEHVNRERQARPRRKRTIGKHGAAKAGVDKWSDSNGSVVDAQHPFHINAQPPMSTRRVGTDHGTLRALIGEIVQ
jgi:hypothetical protein